MTELKNPLKIHQFPPRTNSGHCGLPSCMAFAVLILQGLKAIHGCPYLPQDFLERLNSRIIRPRTLDDKYDDKLQILYLPDFISS